MADWPPTSTTTHNPTNRLTHKTPSTPTVTTNNQNTTSNQNKLQTISSPPNFYSQNSPTTTNTSLIHETFRSTLRLVTGTDSTEQQEVTKPSYMCYPSMIPDDPLTNTDGLTNDGNMNDHLRTVAGFGASFIDSGLHSNQDNYQEGHGHFFVKKTFHKPTYCHHCVEMLWGLIGQGYYCEVCNFICHDRCRKLVISPCSSIAPILIKNPVCHIWSDSTRFKRKFCNVCRKRLEDFSAVRCEICEYYAHEDCKDFAVNDCRETATYVPNRDNTSVRHHHHWREGNLPTNSKCAVCRKTCWSSECLAGMRCEWCGITTHSTCRMKVPEECNFGTLRDIIIPPYAISIPRSDLNKESILGIGLVRRFNEVPAISFVPAISPCSPSTISVGATSSSNFFFSTSNTVGQHTALTAVRSYNDMPPQSPSKTEKTKKKTLYRRLQRQSSFALPRKKTQREHRSIYRVRSISQENPSVDAAPDEKSEKTSSNPSNSASNNTPYIISDQPSQVQLSTPITSNPVPSSKRRDKSSKAQDEEEEREIIKVFDGNAAYRENTPRAISVPKIASYRQILEAALRTFHINDDLNKYCITVPIESDNGKDHSVDENNPLKSIRQLNSKRHVFIRYRETDNDLHFVRVYPGIVNCKTNDCFKTIIIDSETTTREVVRKALDKFGLHGAISESYSLVEVVLISNINYTYADRVLEEHDHPLSVLRQQRQESVRSHRVTRFYLQHKEDPHGPSVSLFVGNLPTGLRTERQYDRILFTDVLKSNKELKWDNMEVIYYEHGAMVLVYNDSVKATKAYTELRKGMYDNKPLMVLMLPNIQPQIMPPNVTPLLVFVNVKSGGQQGSELITNFRHLLNPHQVFDLQNGGPLPGLYVFRNIPHYRILACGGDGTVGWVLSCLDNVGQDALCQSPPVGIVPLGTGNDLARVLRWGSGYTGGEEPISLLRDIVEAEEIKLDRWTVVFHQDQEKRDPEGTTNEDKTEMFVMNNYFGLGLDADICLDFHMAREENPNKFNSRIQAKGYYIKTGLRKIMKKGGLKDFTRDIILEVDGKRIDLPSLEGIIILNILSWASGANLWGHEKDDKFSRPTHYDGMLEVCGVTGIVHMGQIQSGIRSAVRLAQGGHVHIRMNNDYPVPVQVDGEPWLQPPCDITIIRSALKATMLRKRKSKIKRRNTEPTVYFPDADDDSKC
ncbi:unnamed protein product [Didymodactylos carnosus]|uniref:Diacylglycerol kinase n=1 Tax=Didymodactylos carnosus TaxID=1234261 RepID=A0A814FQZ7_9BILA|nr:unnamed protein product [Didymodactylos carnosus]CAF0985502.1 unnamed protein product [Didymodactylos carnosus]CAF3665862.1 unnamed protein product [Didymodactylos carnosus]CAF3757760.1 unnamed protein product [Didymodactylos carnosus]